MPFRQIILLSILFLLFIYTLTILSAESQGGIYSKIWREPVAGIAFRWIPGCCFKMGSPSNEKGRGSDEGPVHEVCPDGFWMGIYEVTNAQYRKYKSKHNSGSFKACSLNDDNQPAVYVSWEDAKAFAMWLTRQNGGQYEFRLPTEAEWEYACRAKTETARFWGENPDDACRYANVADRAAKSYLSNWTIHNCEDGYGVTAPAGSLEPNSFGLYDMLGNVWEWCEDTYSRDAHSKHRRNNPIYNGAGVYRVIRGGSWVGGPRFVRCADRYSYSPGAGTLVLGFRLLRTP